MTTEQIVLELFGILLPLVISYLTYESIPLSSLLPSWSKEANRLVFIGAPAALYLGARLYFAILFYLIGKIPSKYKAFGKIFLK